ncbi:MAG: lysine exporter LysO family protein [Limnochordia bacterium]|nr:lysine exporter LysO family protein [Limnochordia bacterium]
MFLFLGALILGFAAARQNRFASTLGSRVSQIGQFALVLLLFSMGLSLGSNPELTSALPILGLKAIVLSLGAIFGSVFFVWLVTVVRRTSR